MQAFLQGCLSDQDVTIIAIFMWKSASRQNLFAYVVFCFQYSTTNLFFKYNAL